MSRTFVDSVLALRSSTSPAATASQSGTPVPLAGRFLHRAVWLVHVHDVVPTGTYTFVLEVSNLQAGSYLEVAALPWVSGVPGIVQIPLSADMITSIVANPQWVRASLVLSGPGALITFASWLSKPVVKAGTARRPGDVVTAG